MCLTKFVCTFNRVTNVSQTVQVKLSRMYSWIFAKNSASWHKNLNFAATELRSKIDFLSFSFFGGERWKDETKVCGASWEVACARHSEWSEV